MSDIIKTAIKNNDLKVVEELFQNVPDLHLTSDEDGNSPLHLAVQSENLQMVHLILNYVRQLEQTEEAQKSYVNRVNQQQNTPLHLAAKDSNHEDLAKLLVLSGADASTRNQTGQTPLHIASSLNHQSISEFLFKISPNSFSPDNLGNSPLHYAIFNNNENLTKIFLTSGIKIEIEDLEENSIFQLALIVENENIIQYLLMELNKILGKREVFLNEQLISYLNIISLSYPERFVDCEHLLKHLSQLRSLGLLRKKALLDLLDNFYVRLNYLRDFQQVCEVEVIKMSETMVSPEQNVDYLQVLTESLSTIASFFAIEELEEELRGIDYEEEFPIFCRLFNDRIDRAFLVWQAIRPLKVILQSLDENQEELPESLLITVLSYMRQSDLNQIITLHNEA